MKYYSCLNAALALLSSTMLIACTQIIQETQYRDNHVKITHVTKVPFLGVHISKETRIMTIGGEDLKDVRGMNSSYLKIPGKPLILFVTGKRGQAVIRIANTITHEVTNIPAYDSEIGANIGHHEQDQFERVKSVNRDLLIIEAGFMERRYTYFIDIMNNRFLREEGYVEGSPDGKMHHYVYNGGVSPE